MHRKHFFGIFLVFVLFFSSCSMHSTRNATDTTDTLPHIVGGPCSYVNISGVCDVKGISGKDIVFRFKPFQANPGRVGFIDNLSFYARNRDFRQNAGLVGISCLNSKNLSYNSFVACGVVPDSSFSCVMEVIKKGTCSPVVFHFIE